MVQFYIGCAGWSYPDWKIGTFYPKTLKSKDFLPHYQKFFDFTELNTSFYHIPSTDNIDQWNEQTQQNFRFSIKIWQNISHKHLNFTELDLHIRNFFTTFQILESKISMFLLQFPPSFHANNNNFLKIQYLMKHLPSWGDYAVEFRHDSWFDSEIIKDIVDKPNFILSTSYNDTHIPFYIENQKKQYIRMIGDRHLSKFQGTQRLQKGSFQDLITHLQKMRKSPTIEEIFVIFNNHYRGFAPQDILDLKIALNLPYKSFVKNKSLLDFI